MYTGFVKEDGFGSREGRQGRFIKDDAKKYPVKVSKAMSSICDEKCLSRSASFKKTSGERFDASCRVGCEGRNGYAPVHSVYPWVQKVRV